MMKIQLWTGTYICNNINIVNILLLLVIINIIRLILFLFCKFMCNFNFWKTSIN